MAKQVKLDEAAIKGCREVKTLLFSAFRWDHTPDGVDYWDGVYERLRRMADHGTSDGRPYVEPEPEKKWRVPTDEDAKRRPKCRVRDAEDGHWVEATLVHVYEKVTGDDFGFTTFCGNGEAVGWRFCEIEDTIPAEKENGTSKVEEWREPTADDIAKRAEAYVSGDKVKWYGPYRLDDRDPKIEHQWATCKGWWRYARIKNEPVAAS